MSDRFTPSRRLGLIQLVAGLALIAIVITVNTVLVLRAGVYVVFRYGPLLAGVLLIVSGVLKLFPDELDPGSSKPELRRVSPQRTAIEVTGGLAFVVAGILGVSSFFDGAFPMWAYSGWFVWVISALVPIGLCVLALGLAHLFQMLPNLDPFANLGYRSFVAWRYLLVFKTKASVLARWAVLVGVLFVIYIGLAWWREHLTSIEAQQLAIVTGAYLAITGFWGILRHSKAASIIFVFGAVVMLGSALGTKLVERDMIPFIHLTGAEATAVLQGLSISQLVGGGLMGLAMFFGTIRAFFTFFTTVPIGGVWIGTAALVCVLSVMSGFETDLRDKILGSNAHIQITREDGEFVDWRDAKAKIDKIPGVVASTPYAVSEVVIAANNNGMNVIIKGIDPATVGNVTDLISDLEDKDAMRRLLPLVDAIHDRNVPQQPRRPNVVDPPPDDMPTGADPIDFSRTDAGVGQPDRRPTGGAGSGSASRTDDKPAGSGSATRADDPPDPAGSASATSDDEFGGDAVKVVGVGTPGNPPRVLDPPPSDMLTTDEAPVDYSQPGFDPGQPINIPLSPSLDRRLQALPGILVGKELVKQTHLYTGEEVRVVSPLSDPSNPDATGTPIPFNRDYRVAGVFYTGMYEYDLKYVYVTLESLQDFLDRGDAVDGIEVRVGDADDTERYVPTETSAGLIREALGPGYRIVDWRELNRSLFSALKLEKIAMFLVLGIVILVASFSIVGNLIMVVIEKAREIALLKTLGASDVGVTQLFAIQGLMIGLIGTLLGVTTGLLLCWAGKEFGLPLNPDVYYIDRLPIHVDNQSVTAAAAAGVLISIAATLYPALLAARVRPAAGMRH